ncbi:MAG TPA: DUF2330 domain-containing protein [Herpetosiphonaceae bacterium]|nr:DUF2330 domain-containing protein [Herpetosiphonaceae bacterium]
MRRLLVGWALAAALFPALALACGGFVPGSTGEITQNEQRLIYAIDRAAGTVTTYEQIAYSGDAAEFAWIIPVPNDPIVDVLENDDAFRELANLTRPRFKYPAAPSCPEDAADTEGGALTGGAPGGVNVTRQGSVGPYEFAVVGGAGPAEIGAWLRDNGYRITPELEQKLAIYTDLKMLFLALRLRNDADSSAITPIKFTVKASDPMLPIQLSATAAAPDTQLNLWFFADEQIAPANARRLLIQPDDLSLSYARFGGHSSDYERVRGAKIDAEQGRGLVAQYAGRPAGLKDPLLRELAASHPYLTKLYGEMSPAEMTLDLLFAGDSSLPDVSNTIDLSSRPSPRVCEDGLPATAARSSLPGTLAWVAGGAGLLALLAGAALVLRRRRAI